jgi:glycine/D-amino acid oxidase-like deaminating enzyme
MKETALDTDCVVLGGGAVGTLVAMLAVEKGYRCLVLRLSDDGRPEAETLRNQAWLQSGALFTRVDGSGEEDIPSALSRRLRAQGQRLLSLLNLPKPTSRGLARFPREDQSSIEAFIEDGRKLGLGRVVRTIANAKAKRLTGPLYLEDSTFVEVPDAPFDEAGMLLTARARARVGGARFIEVESPVSLEPNGSQCRLVIGKDHFRAPRLVLAAGIGNLELLDSLGVNHRLEVQRTPLLVVPRTEGVDAPIFIDRSRKLAVARHGRDERLPDGCLVAGVSVAEPVAGSALSDRKIPREEWERIYELLPREIQPDRSSGHRFTCGYEVMRGGPNRVRKQDLIVEKVSGFENMVLALPGRATLAYRAAERVLEQLGMSKATETEKQTAATWPKGTSWTGAIAMHHQRQYDDLDERERGSS